jgi:hypothetical protein
LWGTDPLWKKYAWQVSVYMLATNKRLRLARYNRDKQTYIIDLYYEPFHSLAEIRDRVLNIESLALDQDLPDCTENTWGCPFGYLHQVEELEPVDEPELQKLVDDYFTYKMNRDISAAGMEGIKRYITEVLAGRPKVLLVSGVTVSRSEFTKQAYTVKEHPEVRLTITKPKERADG